MTSQVLLSGSNRSWLCSALIVCDPHEFDLVALGVPAELLELPGQHADLWGNALQILAAPASGLELDDFVLDGLDLFLGVAFCFAFGSNWVGTAQDAHGFDRSLGTRCLWRRDLIELIESAFIRQALGNPPGLPPTLDLFGGYGGFNAGFNSFLE